LKIETPGFKKQHISSPVRAKPSYEINTDKDVGENLDDASPGSHY
jgi:hypothetical protein